MQIIIGPKYKYFVRSSLLRVNKKFDNVEASQKLFEPGIDIDRIHIVNKWLQF